MKLHTLLFQVVTHEMLNAALIDIIDHLERSLSDCSCELYLQQLRNDISVLSRQKCDDAISAKRSVILMAVWRFDEIGSLVEDTELLSDLKLRVLPVFMPSYVRGLFQRADALLAAVATMTLVWPVRENF